MKRVLLLSLILLVGVTFLFAGGKQEAKTKGDKPVIAFVSPEMGAPWFVRCQEGVKKAAEDLGFDYVYVGTDKPDAAKQVGIFVDQVNRGVDAIVLATYEATLFEKVTQDALNKGIPVFGFDVGGPNMIWLASGWEPEQSGINIATGLAEEISGKGKVAILTGTLGSPFLLKRQKAMEATFAKYPGIEVIGVFVTDDDYEKGLSVCESIIQANPDIKGFACCVATALTAAGRAITNAKIEGKVGVWGVALGKQNADFVKKGVIKGGLILDAAKMTYLASSIAFNYVTNDGELPKGGEVYGWAGTPITLVENHESYVDDVLLTPENVDIFEF